MSDWWNNPRAGDVAKAEELLDREYAVNELPPSRRRWTARGRCGMSVLDLFSGVGWGIGARELGIEEEGVEIMPEAVATRDAIGLKTVHDDVWTYDYQYAGHLGHITSAPCQTFSTAGKGAGRKALDDVLSLIRDGSYRDLSKLRTAAAAFGDERTGLVLVPLFAWSVEQPEWVAWEQVPTVQPVWDACADVMREAGYSVWTGRLQAEQYGVPQTRKRSILIASRVREVKAPVPTHSRYYSRNPQKLDEGVAKWMSMAEALGWGLVARPSYTYCGVSANAVGDVEWGGASVRKALRDARDSGDPRLWLTSNYGTGGDPPPTIAFGHDAASARWVLRNNNTANAAERELDQPAPTMYFGQRMNYVAWEQRRNSGPGAARTPRSVDEPCYTIRAQGSGSHPCGVELVPPDEKSVRVQVHEAGLLQSFPADLPWQGTKTKQYLQVGNAVPPGLAIPVLGEAAGIDWVEANEAYRGKVFGEVSRMDVEHPSGVVVRTSMGTPKVDGRNGTHELDPFNRPAHTVTTKAGEWIVRGGSE